MTENASAAPTSLSATERVRLAVYHGFARTGRPPSVPELAACNELTPDQVRQELRTLHAQRLARISICSTSSGGPVTVKSVSMGLLRRPYDGR